MKRPTQSIYIPCEILIVRAIVSPSQRLTKLDTLVLEAIGRSNHPLRLEQIIEMFGIGQRPTLDLVQDLWNGGHITVDAADGFLRLTEPTRRLLHDGLLGNIESVRRDEQLVKVMRELITGHVIRKAKTTTDHPSGLTVPPEVDVSNGRLTGGEQAEMIEAVEASLRRTFAGQPLKLVDAIVVEGAAAQQGLGHIGLRASVDVQLDTNELQISVRQPSRIPPHVREDISRRLERIARDKPKLHVFKNLAAQAPQRYDGYVEPIERVIDELRVACQTLRDGADGDVAVNHATCSAIASDVLDLLRSRAARAVHVDVLGGSGEIHEAIRDAIRDAREQIVMACPRVDWSGYERFADQLRPAMKKRGVRVGILWGLEVDELIDPRFAGGLSQLQAEAPFGVLLRSVQSARSHAKVVVSDGSTAIVSSADFLYGTGSGAEIGLRVCRLAAGAAEPVIETLEWARSITPDSGMRGALVVPGPDRPDATLPRIPDAPTASDVSAAACRAEWGHFMHAVEHRISDAAPSARLVPRNEHRRELLRAIKSAKWRLLVTSDRLSAQAMDIPTLRLLRDRLAEGLHVALVWRRGRPDDPAEDQLRALAAEFPNHLTLVRDNNHAKVVVCDDEVIVSSYNFLSFAGDYDSPKGYRLANELGVHVASREIADRVVVALSSQLRGVLGPWHAACVPPVVERMETTPVETAALSGIQTLLESLGTTGNDRRARNRTIASFIAETAAVDDVLEVLTNQRADPADGEAALVYALLRSDWEPGARWRAMLATRLWRRGQFFETSAVLAAAAQPRPDDVERPQVPSLRVALLAAARHDESAFAQQLSEIVTSSDASGAEVNCAAILGAHAVASEGWASAAEALEGITGQSGLGTRLAMAVLRGWWERTTGTRIPLGALAELVAHQSTEHERRQALDELQQAFGRGLRPNPFPSFEPGEKTLINVFGNRGSLRPVLVAVERGDASAVAGLLREVGSADDVADDAFEAIPANLRPRRLLSPMRGSIVRTIAAAIDAARAWSKASAHVAPSLDEYERAALMELRLQLSSLWPELEEACGADDVAAVLFTMCRDLLTLVMRWTPDSPVLPSSPRPAPRTV